MPTTSLHFNQQIIVASKGGSFDSLPSHEGYIKDEQNKTDRVQGKQTLLPKGTPEWVRENVTKYYQLIEASDEARGTPQYGQAIEFALPDKLNIKQNKTLVNEFLEKHFVSKGFLADYAIHQKLNSMEPINTHVHVIIPFRKLVKDLADHSQLTIIKVENVREATKKIVDWEQKLTDLNEVLLVENQKNKQWTLCGFNAKNKFKRIRISICKLTVDNLTILSKTEDQVASKVADWKSKAKPGDTLCYYNAKAKHWYVHARTGVGNKFIKKGLRKKSALNTLLNTQPTADPLKLKKTLITRLNKAKFFKKAYNSYLANAIQNNDNSQSHFLYMTNLAQIRLGRSPFSSKEENREMYLGKSKRMRTLRKDLAETMNSHLINAGFNESIEHRSYFTIHIQELTEMTKSIVQRLSKSDPTLKVPELQKEIKSIVKKYKLALTHLKRIKSVEKFDEYCTKLTQLHQELQHELSNATAPYLKNSASEELPLEISKLIHNFQCMQISTFHLNRAQSRKHKRKKFVPKANINQSIKQNRLRKQRQNIRKNASNQSLFGSKKDTVSLKRELINPELPENKRPEIEITMK